MPSDLKPDTAMDLAALIEKAKQITHRTPEQARAARRGYVLAEAALGGDADEAAWREAFNAGDQTALDRLNAEGEARLAIADEIGKKEGWW